jgi:hypothetical protein
MKQLSTLLFSLLLGYPLFAQNYADCAVALEICNKDTLILPMVIGAGNDPNELNNLSCFQGFPNIETNSSWIRWEVAESGTLWFIISPFVLDQDIDFAVFKLQNGDCNQKETVRCMAAGDFYLASPCMGPTGLLPGETDVQSPAGCSPGTNNYLAPLNVIAGESYVLAINNFSSNIDTVQVEFFGTALLGCETASDGMVNNNLPGASNDLNIGPIVPNPVGAAVEAQFQVHTEQAQKVLVQCFDTRGQLLSNLPQSLSSGTNTLSVDTSNFTPGVYFISIIAEKTTKTIRLVKK